jgi:hypothetical protein
MDQYLHRLDVRDGAVAFGPGRRFDVALFVPAFARAWPIEDAAQFTGLLHEIDDAEGELKRGGAARSAPKRGCRSIDRLAN